MFGKGAILIVMSFTISFSIYQLKMSRAVFNSMDSFNQQYVDNELYHAKLSAMNVGVNRVWDENITSGSFNVNADDCSSMVSITPVGLDTVKLKVITRTNIFDEDNFAVNGALLEKRDSVIAFFKYRSPVSSFFWFTENEGNVHWVSGDTVWGPLHTNGLLKVSGSPVFNGKVTATLGITPLPTDPSNTASYLGGYEIGNSNVVTTDMSTIITAATTGNGAAAINTRSLYDREITLEFLDDGRVIRTVETDPPDTLALSVLAPTGALYSTETVHVKGDFNGELSVYTSQNIYIEGNLAYADDPMINPHSDDMLGLIAGQNVIVADNADTQGDVTVQASIMAMTGSFLAENYNTRAVNGSLRLLGSIYQQDRGAIGTFDWGTNNILSGFQKNYRFDDRLSSAAPPYYPFVRNLQLIAWWE